ncbi:phospholipid/glycerol acyltransferase [Gluconacetobacter diazotrophicus PA1 5]|uniref:1-acyl-sn-glycerol-3-phosphate acyltransferase n=2 Tax=Gluconacetobacter diazotrophicus TaxID=33996 RepID=A0A7W4I405_GLUDI|nr:lysophospholipid acyltransferase family protein [Gluconacetobacter diazotrophicus]ACI52799.1 phospholipid/glycerol acyltransferase [Gluconacetobacter diazotrophicus PA1 5]MBB2155462.1 1-acyl-sn-glycerol-3-phosphate acyltransferase [Gluconacetobacter diazotrophicus]TWB09056.1 1-acyl-sn-glycerol-3-phosphate acyltransferase [Gluconacetobacter diazotrophicus]CAP57241.1 putative acetyl transferase [Gluconacetobacter diazotrophicus PA1 5]
MTFVRACLFNLCFVTLTVVMGIAALPIRLFAHGFALRYAKLWTRLSVAALCRICGIRVIVTGRENLPAGQPCLLASQHQSAFDTLVWMNLVDRPAYVMKEELTRIPLVGPMLLLAGMIPVRRTDGPKALRALLAATGQAAADARQIVIFPEGTRTRPGEKARLHPGIVAMANHTGLPVIPVATDSGLRWSRNAFFKRPGPIHIAIGPALPPGLGRAGILPAISAAWDELSGRFGKAPSEDNPVDNSVGVPVIDQDGLQPPI